MQKWKRNHREAPVTVTEIEALAHYLLTFTKLVFWHTGKTLRLILIILAADFFVGLGHTLLETRCLFLWYFCLKQVVINATKSDELTLRKIKKCSKSFSAWNEKGIFNSSWQTKGFASFCTKILKNSTLAQSIVAFAKSPLYLKNLVARFYLFPDAKNNPQIKSLGHKLSLLPKLPLMINNSKTEHRRNKFSTVANICPNIEQKKNRQRYCCVSQISRTC